VRRFSGVIVLAAIAIVGWKIGSVLSRDALGMAVGVIFGMMAGIPAALIAVSLKRQVPAEQPSNQQGERLLLPAPAPAPRPKIIIVQPERALLSAGNQQRIEVKK
jgi:hypothetical protein